MTLKRKQLKIRAFLGHVLGVKVYRGYAPLSDLSRMSQADIYDQKANPTGTQRDLSPKHAKEAYEYVRDRTLAYWPEVFLCVRDTKVVKFTADPSHPECGTLTVDLLTIKKSQKISISRVDGNHRLHFADGHDPSLPPLDKEVSFCLAVDLTLDDEISLFRDINNNQKRMNTSHLDNIQTRLSSEQILMQKDPPLYIAQKLGRSKDSPLNGWVYEGGIKKLGSAIPLRTLKTGIEYMLSRPTKLTALRDAEAQFKVIRNYFSAVKSWIPDAWDNPKDYLVLRGAGLWGVCFLGADVIDRALSRGAFEPEQMSAILESGKKWDWTSKGSFAGFSGRSGAVKISEMIANEFADTSGVSVRELYKKIMGA
ncbi:MAG: DGQHR domain-containing protein [Chthoniobacteraceae bacterium]